MRRILSLLALVFTLLGQGQSLTPGQAATLLWKYVRSIDEPAASPKDEREIKAWSRVGETMVGIHPINYANRSSYSLSRCNQEWKVAWENNPGRLFDWVTETISFVAKYQQAGNKVIPSDLNCPLTTDAVAKWLSVFKSRVITEMDRLAKNGDVLGPSNFTDGLQENEIPSPSRRIAYDSDIEDYAALRVASKMIHMSPLRFDPLVPTGLPWKNIDREWTLKWGNMGQLSYFMQREQTSWKLGRAQSSEYFLTFPYSAEALYAWYKEFHRRVEAECAILKRTGLPRDYRELLARAVIPTEHLVEPLPLPPPPAPLKNQKLNAQPPDEPLVN